MDVKQARLMKERFIAAMRQNGSKERGIVDNEWLIDHLLDKTEALGIETVDPQVLRAIALHYMGTDILDRAVTKTQATIKASISAYWAFCVHGQLIKKISIYPKGVPEPYKLMFMEFCDDLETQQLTNRTAQGYKSLMKNFFCYLFESGIGEIRLIEIGHMHDFVEAYFLPKKNGIRETNRLARIIDWLYSNGYISFGSNEAFPYGYGRNVGGKAIPSYYSHEELQRIFAVVDRTTDIGKRDYLVLCLLAIYGMRIGDVLDLRLGDIDWDAGVISKVQNKTGNVLCLPLIDTIKDALLDYLDNSRPDTTDDHLLVRRIAPFVAYSCISSFTKMVGEYMQKAHVDTHGRHHGCHALRHSMAGGMLAEGATIEQISDVLGHSSIDSTKGYLSFDANVMKRLGLEVPDAAL